MIDGPSGNETVSPHSWEVAMQISDSGSMLRYAIAGSISPRRNLPLIALAASAAAAVLLNPGVARAADQAAPEAEPGTLQEVIVTAERREERLIDVPISTAVLSGESLQVLGSAGQDIRQLAFSVPSLNIESSNGRTFPRLYIRGYGNTDFTTFASQPVGLYYDDIVQENPALKGFPIFDQQDVEVLRGPQGTLFGRNSPAGVVKIESMKPQLGLFSGYVAASDATYNTANVEAVVNVPIGDMWSFRASTQAQHRDNWVNAPHNLPFNQHLEGYDDDAVRLQLLFKPSDSFSGLLNVHTRWLGGSARLFRANDITGGTNSLVPGFDPSIIYTDGYNGQSYTSIGSNLHLNWTIPDFTFQSITGYESIRHYLTIGDIDGGFGPGVLFPSGPPAPSGPGYIPFAVETGGFVHNYQLTQEFRAVSNASGPLQGQAGLFFFYEDTTGIAKDYVYNSLVVTDSTTSEQKNDAEAVFGSLEYAFSSEWKVRAGLRYTLDHKTFDVPFTDVHGGLPPPPHASASATKLNWDLSPTYQLAPEVNLYARIATGFRAPSFGAPEAGPPPTPVQVARSEDNISYELGIKAETPDHRSSVAFDVYYFDVSHQQLTVVGGAANVTQLVNAQDTIGKGAELELHARPVSHVEVSLAGSYNQTRIEDPTLAVAPCFNWSFAGGPKCTELNSLNAQGFALLNGNPLPEAPRWVGDFSLRYGQPVGPGGELYLFSDMSYRSDMNFFLDKELEFVGPPLFQLGVRIGYTWSDGKYEIAAFCRNCTDQIRNIGGINFENLTGFINDPRIIGGQLRVKF
jgi:iron complex outermembrane receptor protein